MRSIGSAWHIAKFFCNAKLGRYWAWRTSSKPHPVQFGRSYRLWLCSLHGLLASEDSAVCWMGRIGSRASERLTRSGTATRPTSMTFFASCICRPLFERRTRKFLGNIPKPRGRCRVSRPGHDQSGRRGASQFADSTGSVIGARLCSWVCRREQDWSGAARRRMTEEWSREIGRKGKQTAPTAREQAGSGKSRMGRVTG